MKNDITKLTAYEIGTLLSKKKIDPIILLELFMENYKLATPNTRNAVCKEIKKEAFLEAEKSWKRQKSNNRLSHFDGIPSGWKDVIDIKNYPALGGSKLLNKLRKNLKVKDAAVVSNARKNGVIPLFKTSTVEFAFGGLGVNSSVEYPKNAMMKNNYCPGGSSSGSAVAVFSNLVPLAVGTDTAGSIRIPSSWHSLVGFKPTFNNISTRGILPLAKSYDTIGTICKSVQDTILFYSILSNSKPTFFYYKKKYTIGVIEDFIVTDLKGNENTTYKNFLNQLTLEKFNLKKVKIPEFNFVNKVLEEQGGVVNYEAYNFWKDSIKKDIEIIDRNVLSRFQLGEKMSRKRFLNIKKLINNLKKNVYSYFEDIDYLLLPTLSIKPPLIKNVLNKENYIAFNNKVLSNTRVANLFNLSAITIPINNGNWLSYTLLAPENNDSSLLAIAQDIENITIK
tara:strand:- start:908 stop:2260 length:1353 start_codon:yes stop_codon:yes gene_type:complete